MIIQSIALLDQLDKDLNTFAMRVREWYGWHFPELKDIVKDNYLYAQCAAYIQVITLISYLFIYCVRNTQMHSTAAYFVDIMLARCVAPCRHNCFDAMSGNDLIAGQIYP